MLREGPRLPAYACETADWSHVDVYLTKTTDYRMLLLAGSRWEGELLRWVKERGAVACRSFQHTVALLLELVRHLTGGPEVPLSQAAEASEHLLETEDEWRPRLAGLLLGPHGTHVVAPARRISSAYQSALMLREGPRLQAYGCETGDWSHVDVYLTKTTDYRMLLLGGSRWEAQLLGWTSQRGSTVVGVGAEVAGASHTLRYPHDDNDDVRLLTETLVAELLAARAWLAAPT
jgi:hypothetical protein